MEYNRYQEGNRESRYQIEPTESKRYSTPKKLGKIALATGLTALLLGTSGCATSRGNRTFRHDLNIAPQGFSF